MKRLVPVALAALLALAMARVPAATAAGPSLSVVQTEELVTSYVRLTADFYKKVDRQAALDGARSSMIDYLKKHKVANATLPALHASEDDASNAEALNREVATAVSEYASRLEPVESLSGSTQITYAAIAGVLGSVKDRYTVFLSPKGIRSAQRGARRNVVRRRRDLVQHRREDALLARRERHPRRTVRQGRAAGRGHDQRDRR